MRVFVCEFVTGGGFLGAPIPPGLRHEGDLMLAALVNDLAAISGVAVTVARDDRLPNPALPATVAWLSEGDDPWAAWGGLTAEADAAWPVAPETGGALERLSRFVLDSGKVLIGSRPDAVRVAASKNETGRQLGRSSVPVVPTWPADRVPSGVHRGRWVLKPDDGAGCEETFLLDRPDDAPRRVPAGELQRFVLQPFVAGTAASLSLLCRDGEAVLLSCNRQAVSCEGGTFRYGGGVVGGMEERRAAFQPVAAAVAGAMPGLWGYAGVDLIDGQDGPVVVEVNPRLTTSYAGLRDAIGGNPAALVMGLLADAPMPAAPAAVRPVTIDPGADRG